MITRATRRAGAHHGRQATHRRLRHCSAWKEFAAFLEDFTRRSGAICVIIRDEMRAVSVAERPELTEPACELTQDALREYNSHGDVLNLYWPRLTEERPEFQVHLIGDG